VRVRGIVLSILHSKWIRRSRVQTLSILDRTFRSRRGQSTTRIIQAMQQPSSAGKWGDLQCFNDSA
jgi:hypothetical protein